MQISVNRKVMKMGFFCENRRMTSDVTEEKHDGHSKS